MTPVWEMARANRAAMGIVTEADRITALPIKAEPSAADLIEKWTARFRRRASARPLFHAQAQLLEQAALTATWQGPYGVVGSMGVGKGKTLTLMLLPRVFQAKRPLLLLPPDLREQTLEAEWEWQTDYNIVMTTTDPDEWRMANGDLRLIVTYGQLSRPDATALLEELQPDLVMADEAHNLANPTAARTMRFLRYMKAHRPEVRFAPLSGTLTKERMQDYAHLVNLALMDKSPIPRHDRDLDLWGSVINYGGEPDRAAEMAVEPLIRWAVDPQGDTLAKRARFSLGRRLMTNEGYVLTTSSSCSADLELRAVYPPCSDTIKEALGELSLHNNLPDGTEVIEAAHFKQSARQLSMGFYYMWDWENGEPDEEWLAARKLWAAEVRAYLARHGREGVDSPFLVERHVLKEQGPPSLYRALLAWQEQREKPPPPVKAVWIDYQVMAWAAHWMSQQERAILWFRSQAVGQMLEQFGVLPQWEGKAHPSVNPRPALAMNVYYKGHELQPWSHQLMLEVPPSGERWEQMLGRTHREGQPAKKVTADVAQHTWVLRDSMTTALAKSEYIEDTTYQPQKLRLARMLDFPR